MREYIKNSPVTLFFLLTFIISWGGILIVPYQTGIPATARQFDKLLPISMIPFLLGPSIAGFIMIGLTKGKKGVSELFKKLLKWCLGSSIYLIALFIIPTFSIISLLILYQFSEVYIPDIVTKDDKTTLILSGLIYGIIVGGLLEELGWSGYAIPKLREKYSVLKTGLIIGIFWGAWHFLPIFSGSGDSSGNLVLSTFLPGLFFHYAGLIPVRILIVWLYDRSLSLIPPIILHATLTAFTLSSSIFPR
ncbi:CPBP family intramembrane metalloprotease [Flagellimonas hymeniacidonis]|uniref:CPBP family intramembrane metalloprotease n=1 Tax=Flagellimonas hymeniacidonis TaxID=2603628 RepID=A0A5C8V1J9_9FLAO|nr:type II CAAX endopeptidase family protein [Flagellimonas hymeniacidonis]TXN34309.1 CPBP family intramembrane metalloprotease [Flagellimonas hymeniacidonis]